MPAYPIVGDDIKSQVGATITHRVLAKLFATVGWSCLVRISSISAGTMDFMNMLERSRLRSKKISKTQSVTSQVPHEMESAMVHISPSDYVPWLDDRKWLMSGWKVEVLEMCRSTWNTSWKCGTRPIRLAW